MIFLSKVPKWLRIAGVVILILGVCVWYFLSHAQGNGAGPDDQAITYSDIIANRGNLQNSITGTGSVEPHLSYDILSLVSGDITSAPYEIGDRVEKGTLLYEIDTTDSLLAIEKQQNSLEQSQISVENARTSLADMTIKAPMSGYVSGLDLNVGERANGVVATIFDYNTAELKADFYTWQIKNLSVGDPISIYAGASGTIYRGTVSGISPVPAQNSRGELVSTIDIVATVAGAITDTASTYVEMSLDGSVYPSIEGSVTAEIPSRQVSAKTAGDITKIYVKNGDYVKEGDVIMTLDSTSIRNTIRSSELSLKSQSLSLEEARQNLSNFNITAPADGIVISKDFKEGDTVSASNDGRQLMQIADLSKMIFTISVDELDIGKIEVGQRVNVVADAYPDQVFNAVVTSVSFTGTAQNGVTTYPVEVTIDNPGNLKIGMNVSAEIITDSALNAILIPSGAIMNQGGKRLVRTDYAEGAEMPEGGYPAITMLDPAVLAGLNPGDSFESDGFIFKCIETGISDGSMTEVTAGLSEGDRVLLSSAASSGGGSGAMRGNMMMGGGMTIVTSGPAPGGGVRRVG